MNKKRFMALDAFRGLCALSVVVFHMHLIDSITDLKFFKGSDILVEFFFVLSGFVLAHGYGFKQNLSFKQFMSARFFRLYPLHFTMFVTFLLLEVGKLVAYHYAGFTFNSIPFTDSFAISEMLPNLLLIQSWTPFTDSLSFNYPSWSISIEFYMYALLFLTIFLFKHKSNLAWISISIGAFSLIYLNSEILVSEVLAGLSCFFAGCATYVIYRHYADLRLSNTVGTILESALIISICITVQSDLENKKLIAPLLFILTVFCFSFESGAISRLLKLNVLQMLGKLSYSIYMTHAAILYCFTSVMLVLQKLTGYNLTLMIENQRYIDFGSNWLNNIVVVLLLLVIIYLSSLSYRHIEVAGQNFYKDRLKKPTKVHSSAIEKC